MREAGLFELIAACRGINVFRKAWLPKHWQSQAKETLRGRGGMSKV